MDQRDKSGAEKNAAFVRRFYCPKRSGVIMQLRSIVLALAATGMAAAPVAASAATAGNPAASLSVVDSSRAAS